jgi:putative tryptophan/tyrosine transport system substrate-binding protein
MLDLRRRQFLTLLGGAAAAWPLAARAQQAARLPVIGHLHSASPPGYTSAFLQGLREEGYVEHHNVVIEYRWAGGAYERLPALAGELVDLRVDLNVAGGTPAARVAKTASVRPTPAIPVIFAMASDPVAEGFVASLNRPGGNMTGITSIAGALAPKRLDLMREFLRDHSAIALLVNPRNPLARVERKDTEGAADAIGQRLEVLTASNEGEIDDAFASLKQRGVGALIIAADVFYYGQMQRLATLAARHAVPTIGPLRAFAAEGGLLSYGASIQEVNRQAGLLSGKVLKGAQPRDLPVQQPTKFELVLNVKTAKALGIELSPKLLALADEVIE